MYLATEAILLAGNDPQSKKWLPALALGPGGRHARARRGPGLPLARQPEDDASRAASSPGKKIGVPDGNVATFAVVAAKSGAGVDARAGRPDGPGRDAHARPSRSTRRVACAEIAFKDAPAELLGDEGRGWELLERVLDRAAVLQAFEQLGGAERAFEMTRDFTMGRYAFGRPIASFQALKHRMADVYVAIELAKSNCYWGAWALSTNDPELALAAPPRARLAPPRRSTSPRVEMVQMHGGVGFTWEYDCHLFYRRAKHQALVTRHRRRTGARSWCSDSTAKQAA